MARAFFLRLILWLLLSLPVAIGAGALVSMYFGEGADTDQFTAAGNGVLAGVWLGLVGGIAAAVTTAVSRQRLRAAGGSECVTGAVVSYGFVGLALVLLVVLS